MNKVFVIFLIVFLPFQNTIAKEPKIKLIASGLNVTWGMSFISDHELIFTERSGQSGLLNTSTGNFSYLKGVPEVLAEGQGGLLDVQVAPDYKQGDWIYFTYSKDEIDGGATTLAKAKLNGNALTDWNDILVTQSAASSGRHYGSRITFDDDGHIYFSVGDRGDRPNSQQLMNHAGSILRLNLDGSIPQDNPFINNPKALDEIWSYGHRNPQGLDWDSKNNRLWSNEHGPRGGDEINLVEKGKNYGWPIISYGKEYWGPLSVGESTHKQGMEQPITYFVPSIAPGSLLKYQGNAYKNWDNVLLSSALKLRHLNVIHLNEQLKVTKQERLFKHLKQRIRALAQSPDGHVYFSTDQGNIYQILSD